MREYRRRSRISTCSDRRSMPPAANESMKIMGFQARPQSGRDLRMRSPLLIAAMCCRCGSWTDWAGPFLTSSKRELVSERTKAGMAAAKRRGAYVGRPRKLSEEQVSQARANW